MRDALQQTVEEYGLVIVGYSGGDDSIMDPLIDADISEYGIYWCVRDTDSFPKEGRAEELLEKPNTYLVEIEGFGSLMRKFGNRLKGLEPPQPDEITARAEERANMLKGALKESKEAATGDEEEEYVDKTEKVWEANSLAQEGNYEKAIELYTEAIEEDPNYTTAYHNRGFTKHRLGEYEAAIADYDKAIELNPDDAGAYTNRGLARQRLGEYEAAIADYDKAIELDPDSANVYYNRGNAKRGVDKYEAAIADYDTAIELNSDDPAAYQNRAETKIELGDFEQARQDASQAKEVSESTEETALSLLFYLISRTALGEDTTNEENEYRNLCKKEFATNFRFEELDSWLENPGLTSAKVSKIKGLIDLVREHKE